MFSIFSGAMYSPCASLKMCFFLSMIFKVPFCLGVWRGGVGCEQVPGSVSLPALPPQQWPHRVLSISCALLLNPNKVWQGPAVNPFYRETNWGWQRLGNLPRLSSELEKGWGSPSHSTSSSRPARASCLLPSAWWALLRVTGPEMGSRSSRGEARSSSPWCSVCSGGCRGQLTALCPCSRQGQEGVALVNLGRGCWLPPWWLWGRENLWARLKNASGAYLPASGNPKPHSHPGSLSHFPESSAAKRPGFSQPATALLRFQKERTKVQGD